MSSCHLYLGVACAMAVASAASGATISLHPVKDNTIFEQPDVPATFSDGAGQILYIGRTGDRNIGLVRRSLMSFDVAGALPGNAVITSATLTLRVDRSGSGGAIETVLLSRVAADWGEGTSVSSGGAGGGASGADATWTNRFFNDAASAWTNAGGDFADDASGVGTLGQAGTYTIADPGLAVDVRDWLAHPATNFGWMLRGDEATLNSAKQIESREGASPPVLTVTYSVPEPGAGCVIGGVVAACVSRRRARDRTTAMGGARR